MVLVINMGYLFQSKVFLMVSFETCGEKLEEIRGQIELLEAQLQELKSREKVLLNEKREEELKQIVEILEERNLSVEDLTGILDRAEEEKCQAESA